jgi:hypothetical protein
MRLLHRGWVCLGMALGLLALPPRPLAAQRAEAAVRPTHRLELEVPNGGILLVDADRIYLPPGASPRAPLNLPGLTRALDVAQRGRVQVNLPAAENARPTITEVWANGTITITLPSGTRLRLDYVMPRARITFEKPDAAWHVLVEPLPSSAAWPRR